ncbi:hypothetical protein IWQ60_008986 [Tieghemiomyces parasiticus]|uniref:Uncharacterized protein n=1 Tax=Tieghemiomyces parasiticus TaxID=78921 RepID=A0A9W8DQ86_9FUNG|nr:hypothetical protein IWQ60_008986 [Tieghemiomyces parasiticus]
MLFNAIACPARLFLVGLAFLHAVVRPQLVIEDGGTYTTKAFRDATIDFTREPTANGQCPLDCRPGGDGDCRRCHFDISEHLYVSTRNNTNLLSIISFELPPAYDPELFTRATVRLPAGTATGASKGGDPVRLYLAEARGAWPPEGTVIDGTNAPKVGDIFGFNEVDKPVDIPVLSAVRSTASFNRISHVNFYIVLLTADEAEIPSLGSGNPAVLTLGLTPSSDVNHVYF